MTPAPHARNHAAHAQEAVHNTNWFSAVAQILYIILLCRFRLSLTHQIIQSPIGGLAGASLVSIGPGGCPPLPAVEVGSKIDISIVVPDPLVAVAGEVKPTIASP